MSDERLTAEEIDAIRTQAAVLDGYGHPPTHEEWEIITRLSRSDSRRLVIPLLADRDALAAENARLKIVLQWIIDTPWRPTEAAIDQIVGHAGAALARREEGEEGSDGLNH